MGALDDGREMWWPGARAARWSDRAGAGRRSTMKLLFLDFDGVLNDEAHVEACLREDDEAGEGVAGALLGGKRWLDPVKVRLIDGLVADTGAGVVISSSWRLRYGLDELNDMLVARGARFHACAVTPMVTSFDPIVPRRVREIVACVEGLGAGEVRAVALDDDELSPWLGWAVRVDGRVGVTERDLARCRGLLG